MHLREYGIKQLCISHQCHYHLFKPLPLVLIAILTRFMRGLHFTRLTLTQLQMTVCMCLRMCVRAVRACVCRVGVYVPGLFADLLVPWAGST